MYHSQENRKKNRSANFFVQGNTNTVNFIKCIFKDIFHIMYADNSDFTIIVLASGHFIDHIQQWEDNGFS